MFKKFCYSEHIFRSILHYSKWKEAELNVMYVSFEGMAVQTASPAVRST